MSDEDELKIEACEIHDKQNELAKLTKELFHKVHKDFKFTRKPYNPSYVLMQKVQHEHMNEMKAEFAAITSGLPKETA